MTTETYKFAGFISYSQKDKVWAKRIHKALENYSLPVGLPSDFADKKRKIGRFFRDDDELAGSPSLGDALTGAINQSRTLIVICSPNSARSKWVDAEIRHFKSRGPDARVLAVIVGGMPDSDDAEVMCFAPSMLRRVDKNGELTDDPDEPLAPDVSKEPLNRLVARLVAGIIGVDFDALWQREQRRIRKRRLMMSAFAVGLIATAGFGYKYYSDAEQARLYEESLNLAAQSQVAADEGKMDEALKLALAALPDLNRPNDRPLVVEAQAALSRVMGGNLSAGVLAKFERSINDLHLFGDQKLAVQFDDGEIVVLDRRNGTIQQKLTSKNHMFWLGNSGLVYSVKSDESLAADGSLKVSHQLEVRSLMDGQTIRKLQFSDTDWYLGPLANVSPDGQRVFAYGSLAAAKKTQNDIAVFSVPSVGSSVNPKLIARIDVPFVKEAIELRADFVSPERVALTWNDDKKMGVALWHIEKGTIDVLSRPNGPMACGGKRADINKRKGVDDVSLSDDKSVIGHARPISGAGWCVSLWDVKTGKSLAPMKLDQSVVGDVSVLDANSIAISKNFRSFRPFSGILRRQEQEPNGKGCGNSRSMLSSNASSNKRWLISSDQTVTACIKGTSINLALGQDLDFRKELKGHNRDIKALVHDAMGQMLYSAGGDGSVRTWDLAAAPQQPDVPGTALKLAGWDGRMAVISREGDGLFQARVFDAQGSLLGSPIDFDLSGLGISDDAKGDVSLNLRIMADDHIMLMGGWSCGWQGCSPGTANQAEIINYKTGEGLISLKDLAGGKFLSFVPVNVSYDFGRKRLAAVHRDGKVSILTIGSDAGPSTIDFGKDVAVDTAFVENSLWVATSDGAEDPENRHMSLYVVDEAGNKTKTGPVKAQDIQLFTAQSNKRALAVFDVIPGPGSRNKYRILSDTVSSKVFEMPFKLGGGGETIWAVEFFDRDRQVALMFSENTAPPYAIRLPVEPAEMPAAKDMRPLAANLEASMLDPWRVNDPLARTTFSLSDNKISKLDLTPAMPVCPGLVGKPADAASFSSDGKLLAVSGQKDYQPQVSIYTAKECALLQRLEVSARHNSELMAFAGPSHLWVISGEGNVHINAVDMGFQAMHKKAVELQIGVGKPSE